jgi:hypothetical protein
MLCTEQELGDEHASFANFFYMNSYTDDDH